MTFLSLFLKMFSGFKATVVSSFSIVDDIRFNTYTEANQPKIRERIESQLIMSKVFYQHFKMEFEKKKINSWQEPLGNMSSLN